MRLTRRGKTVLLALALAGAFLIGLGTSDYCWDGSGYSTCTALDTLEGAQP